MRIAQTDDDRGLTLVFAPGADADLGWAGVEATSDGGQRLRLWAPGAVADGVSVEASRAPISAVEVAPTAAGIYITVGYTTLEPISLLRAPWGWRLGPTRPPGYRGPPIDAGGWAGHLDAQRVVPEVHRAVQLARRGDGAKALLLLRRVARGPGTAALRGAVSLTWAQLARREHLPLLALAGAARAVRYTTDSRVRAAALAMMVEIDGRIPGALSLVAADIAPVLRQRAGPDDARSLLALTRSLLQVDEPQSAARLAWMAHHQRPVRHRARLLAATATRLADEPAVATTHLEALIEATTPARLKAEAWLSLSRLAYEAGQDATAGDARREALAAAEADGGSTIREAVRVERGWQALRAGNGIDTLAGLIPLDLERHGAPRALLVGTLYHALCYPERASAIATALVDRPWHHPVGRQLAIERSHISQPRMADLRDDIAPLIDQLERRYETLLSLSPDMFYRRQALRLRITADRWAINEVDDRLKTDGAPIPVEPPLPTWRGSVWDDPIALADRCPLIGAIRPFDPRAQGSAAR